MKHLTIAIALSFMFITSTCSFAQTAYEYLEQGKFKASLNDHNGALTDFNRALALDPAMYEAYYRRGIVKEELGNFDAALEDYERSLQVKRNKVAFNNKASLLMKKGETRKAIRHLNKAIRLDKEYAVAYNNRAFARHKLGRERKACRDFNRAAELGLPEMERIIKEYCRD